MPDPALASLPPHGRAWGITRYRAYQAHLAGHTTGGGLRPGCRVPGVLQPFYVREGRYRPCWSRGSIDPGARGGEPVISGTRIPYDEVAALLRVGVAAEDIGEFFRQVSPAAARDAYDFASYVDSYVQPPERAA